MMIRTYRWAGIDQSVKRLATGWTVRDGILAGATFPHQFRPAVGPTRPPVQCVPGLFPRRKRPGRGPDRPIPSGAGVKERVELYLYSPSGHSWPALRRTLPST